MRVYEVKNDHTFQSFVVRNKIWEESDLLIFNAKPKQPHWQPLEVVTYDPHKPEGDFINFYPGALLLGSALEHEEIRTFCEIAGELLPVVNCDNGRNYELLNVLECVNCLDYDKTEWVYDKETGERLYIKKYVFDEVLFPESTIFKVPECMESHIFVYEDTSDPEEEFKAAVEYFGLTGISFDLVWEG